MYLSSRTARLTVLALLSASTFYCFYKSRRLKLLKTSFINPNKKPKTTPNASSNKGKLFFISQTGTSKTLAHRLHTLFYLNDLSFDLIDPKAYEPEDLSKETILIIVASTWEGGKPPANARFFANWLAESADDFRVGSLLLSKCKFAVFGVGSRAYGETFNAVAKDFSRWLKELGGKEIVSVGEGDVDSGEMDAVFEEWSGKVVTILKGGGVENGGVFSNNDENVVDEFESDGDDDDNGGADVGIVDLEDIAGKGPSRKSNAVAETNGKLNGQKEMVTPVIRANLEKQAWLL